MKVRRWHGCHEPDQKVVGVEDESTRPVLPGVLEPELERAVGEPLEALLNNGRPRDVTAQPLELSVVAAVVLAPRGGGSG